MSRPLLTLGATLGLLMGLGGALILNRMPSPGLFAVACLIAGAVLAGLAFRERV